MIKAAWLSYESFYDLSRAPELSIDGIMWKLLSSMDCYAEIMGLRDLIFYFIGKYKKKKSVSISKTIRTIQSIIFMRNDRGAGQCDRRTKNLRQSKH